MKMFWTLDNLLSESGNDKQRLAAAQVKKPRLFFIMVEIMVEKMTAALPCLAKGTPSALIRE